MTHVIANKIVYVFNIQSITDVITNSSSELFVYRGNTDTVKELLDSVTPGWESEYNDPVLLQDLSPNSLETYLDYKYRLWDWNTDTPLTKETSNQTLLSRKFNIDPHDIYDNYDEWDPNSYDMLCYKEGWDKIIKEKLSQNLVFVFSKYDNPDYNRQEIMEQYGTRYHLG